MSNATPAVRDLTVVVSCYNHQAFIEQCLDSIARQSVPVRQVIVIDDASKDQSVDVIERWLADHDLNWTFIKHEKNRGVCATLNEAVELSESSFFVHVSGDDWEPVDRFQRQADAFADLDDGIALLVGDLREVDAGGGTIVEHDYSTRLGHVTGPENQSALLQGLLAENVIPAPGTMIRTSAIREIGGFDEDLAFEDYDMWMRLASRYAIAYLPGIVANYRVVDSGLTRNVDRRVSVLTSEADMLAKHIGSSPANDAIIARRLLPIAGEIMLLGSVSGVRHVLGEAMAASPEPGIRTAYRDSRTRRGIERLVTTRAKEFGVKPPVAAASGKAPRKR